MEEVGRVPRGRGGGVKELHRDEYGTSARGMLDFAIF